MIGPLLRLGLPPGIAKLVPWLIGALALLAALWWLRSDAYRDGVRATNAKWEQRIAADKTAQLERERRADAQLTKQKADDTLAFEARTKDIDHATKGIPDQTPSERQRRRACLQLHSEAKAGGFPKPACIVAPARR